MKKIRNVCLTVFLCLFCGASVWADTAPDGAKADYATDYYMIVQSPDGGIDIYDTPDFDGQKLNDDPIPNGMALHIEGEVEDGDRTWGYTEYHGMHGYVPLDDCEPVTRSRAIESEIETRGSEPADYDVEADSPEGSVALYNGPGEKFGEVSDAEEIPNGETIHITETVEGDQGITWGKTEKDDKEGWVNLEETINPDAVETESGEAAQNGQDDRAGEESTGLVSMETESSGSGEESAAGESAGTDTAVTPTSESAESAVVTQAPTQTPTVTPAPSATVTLVPDETEETGGVSVAAGGVGQTGEEDNLESESSETETDDENPEDTTLLARAEESEDEDSGDETEKTRLTATPRPTQTSAADSEDSGDSETGLEVAGGNVENEDSSEEDGADAEATEENATDAEATEEDASDLEATGENATDAEATEEDAAGSEESKEEETSSSSAMYPFVWIALAAVIAVAAVVGYHFKKR